LRHRRRAGHASQEARAADPPGIEPPPEHQLQGRRIVPRLALVGRIKGQIKYRVAGFQVCDPLAVYRRRRTITHREHRAGEKYADLWFVAREEEPRMVARYEAPMPRQAGPPNGRVHRRTWAMERLAKVNARLRPLAESILLAVTVDRIDAKRWAKGRGLRGDDGLALLRVVLATVAEAFGLVDERD
jgi:hypothetical protein